MGDHELSQPAGHVGRVLMVASFPLRLVFQRPEVQKPGSAAAVHHYGPEGKGAAWHGEPIGNSINV
jgi:hypothetical protein